MVKTLRRFHRHSPLSLKPKMENKAFLILDEGRKLIDPIMRANGFHWQAGSSGKSSGGYFASGQYVKKNNRRLELHLRHSLGLVTYHIARLSLSHEDYMAHTAGKGKYQYPGFSSDPLDGFKHLASDLENYASDFLSGTGEDFKKARESAEERNKLSGFKKIFKD
jgi:hypothetical protein